jgi:hypothetical protein
MIYKWLSIVFLVLSAVPIYFLSTISKGNFLAGPMSIFMSIPLIIIQGIIVWVVWKNSLKIRRNLFLTIISFLVLCFESYLLYKYITEIT